jgi:hypothetical protein
MDQLAPAYPLEKDARETIFNGLDESKTGFISSSQLSVLLDTIVAQAKEEQIERNRLASHSQDSPGGMAKMNLRKAGSAPVDKISDIERYLEKPFSPDNLSDLIAVFRDCDEGCKGVIALDHVRMSKYTII